MSEIIIKTIESVDYSFYERINFERAETETEKQDTPHCTYEYICGQTNKDQRTPKAKANVMEWQ